MDEIEVPLSRDLARELRRALLSLARVEEETALAQAAAVRYWEPCPASVYGHRAAAQALRIDADRFASFAHHGSS